MMRFGPWPPESCVYCQRTPTQPSRSLRAAAGSERVGVDRERVHVSHAVEEVPQELRRHLDVGVGRGAPLAPGVAEDGEVEGGDHRAAALDVDSGRMLRPRAVASSICVLQPDGLDLNAMP